LLSAFFLGCRSYNHNDSSKIINTLKKINGEPVIPRGANRIHILRFSNTTSKADLPERIFMKLKEKISMDGRLAVVAAESDADLLLAGSVTEYFVQNIEFGSFGKPVKKRLRITVTLRLKNLRKNEIIFRKRGLESFKIYSDSAVPVISDMQAYEETVDRLAGRIFSQTVTGWYTDKMTEIEKGR